jgi:hypothetical protein
MLLVRQDETRIVESNSIVMARLCIIEKASVDGYEALTCNCHNLCIKLQTQKIHKSRNATIDAVYD